MNLFKQNLFKYWQYFIYHLKDKKLGMARLIEISIFQHKIQKKNDYQYESSKIGYF